MKIFIVLATISGAIDRTDLERIEGTSYTTKTTYPSKEREVLEFVKHELGIESDENLEVIELHEFTELLNNQEFNYDKYWTSYVTLI